MPEDKIGGSKVRVRDETKVEKFAPPIEDGSNICFNFRAWIGISALEDSSNIKFEFNAFAGAVETLEDGSNICFNFTAKNNTTVIEDGSNICFNFTARNNTTVIEDGSNICFNFTATNTPAPPPTIPDWVTEPGEEIGHWRSE